MCALIRISKVYISNETICDFNESGMHFNAYSCTRTVGMYMLYQPGGFLICLLSFLIESVQIVSLQNTHQTAPNIYINILQKLKYNFLILLFYLYCSFIPVIVAASRDMGLFNTVYESINGDPFSFYLLATRVRLIQVILDNPVPPIISINQSHVNSCKRTVVAADVSKYSGIALNTIRYQRVYSIRAKDIRISQTILLTYKIRTQSKVKCLVTAKMKRFWQRQIASDLTPLRGWGEVSQSLSQSYRNFK